MLEPLLTLGGSRLFFPASLFRKIVKLLKDVVDRRSRFGAQPEDEALRQDIAREGTDDPWRLFLTRFAGYVGLGLPFAAEGEQNLQKLFAEAETDVQASRFFAITLACMEDPRTWALINSWWQPVLPASAPPEQQDLAKAINRYVGLLTPMPNGQLPKLGAYDRDPNQPKAFRFLIERLELRDRDQPNEWWIEIDRTSVVLPGRSWNYGLIARLRRWNTGYAFPRKWQGTWTARQFIWIVGLLSLLAALAAIAWSSSAGLHA